MQLVQRLREAVSRHRNHQENGLALCFFAGAPTNPVWGRGCALLPTGVVTVWRSPAIGKRLAQSQAAEFQGDENKT